MKKRKLVIVVLGAVVVTILVALALLASKLTTLEVLRVAGRDMEPTLHQDDRIVVTRDHRTPQRLDIIVFRYPANPSQLFTKRIVGLPGELVEISEGKISVDGKLLEEDYVDPQFNRFTRNETAFRIPNDSYYVLGDNRDNSNDSRLWGPLRADAIEGVVLFHY